MKIWHLTRTIHGGAGQYALRLSNALCSAGCQSAVLAAEGTEGDGIKRLNRVDSPVRRFAARGFRSLSHRISFAPFHSLRGPELYQSSESIGAGDVVHLHGMTGWIGVAGLSRLIPHGARFFWTAHDLWMLSGGCVVYRGCDEFQRDCYGCPILRPPWKWMARQELQVKQSFMEKYQIHPIANSQWMADRIRESSLFKHLDNIPIIPPIVDDAYLSEGISDLRQEMGIPAGRLVISLGARSIDDKFKGIPQFLELLSRTKELAGSLTVLVFGPGNIDVPGNLDVRLLGSLSDPQQLAKVYRTSNVYVSPSQMETFGMTLVEAQACGTPVICFSVGGTPEAVRDGETGWLTPCGDFQALMERLRLLLKDLPKLTATGENARRWSRAMFCGNTVASRQNAIYSNRGSSKFHG